MYGATQELSYFFLGTPIFASNNAAEVSKLSARPNHGNIGFYIDGSGPISTMNAKVISKFARCRCFQGLER
jgi:hypothetical protein